MENKQKQLLLFLLSICLLAVVGCGKKNEAEKQQPDSEIQSETQLMTETEDDTEGILPTETESDSERQEPEATEEEQDTETTLQQSDEQVQENQAEDAQEVEVQQEVPQPAQITTSQNAGTGISYPSSNGHIVCIDPGHQAQGDSTPEPVAPGASETKARVTSGTSGRTTGVAEYQLTLQVSLKLRDELIARGYGVVMTRETNEVNISNSERAQIAANGGADAFIRIHANGSEDSSVNGAMTICQTAGNPYVSGYYSQSRSLSQNVLDAFCAATGAGKQYVWETDTMSGINWSQMPVTILEMGYMTNPTEDTNMSTEDYQNQMVQGIANGIDAYYAGQ